MNLSLSPASRLKYTFKTKPFSHQKKALNKILQLDGKAALFMEMGTGKTKVAIDWAGIQFYNGDCRRVLVVAPLSVLGVWPAQIRTHATAPGRAFRLSGSTDSRVALLKRIMRNPDDSKLTYIIINYEGIWRENSKGTSVEKLLIRWKPDLVIFDESHRLKSATSKQSRSAYKISQAVLQRLALTGTPVTKAPLDVYGQLRCVEKGAFGMDNWWAFKRYYGIWGGFAKHQLKGYRHIDELIKIVHKWSYRVKKKDCLDLPEKLFLDVPVTLSPKAISLYTEMAKEMIVEIEETHATASIVLVKLLRLSQITSGFLKDVDGNIRIFDSSKLNTCMDLVNDVLEEQDKLTIFCRFIPDIQRLAEQMTEKSIKYRILSGSVTGLHRDRFIEEFHENPDIQVMIAQTQAGSLGIDLTPASSGIFYSLGYNAADYWQAQDRMHRIPCQQHALCRSKTADIRKKNMVTYYHLIAPRTIDQIVLGVLKDKGKIAEAVLHNPRILLP